MINIAKPLIGDEEKLAVLEVLDSGIIAQGPRVKAFEGAFAAICVNYRLKQCLDYRLTINPFS